MNRNNIFALFSVIVFLTCKVGEAAPVLPFFPAVTLFEAMTAFHPKGAPPVPGPTPAEILDLLARRFWIGDTKKGWSNR